VKKKGRGMSLGVHPTGLKGGGDPSQAQIRLKPDGTFDLLSGAVDIGQGCKTVLRQIAADELGVPLESITLNNVDTDVCPMTTGTFASRVTFMDGNAVIKAAQDLVEKMRQAAAKMMEVDAGSLVVAENKIFVKDDPTKAMTMAELGGGTNWGGEFLVGTGAFWPGPGQSFGPEDGKMTAVSAVAFHCCVAEVEVDTETGQVEVTNLVHVCDVGKAVNPLLCMGQINGGSVMGLSYALNENVYPYYPSLEHPVSGLADYYVTTAADVPAKMTSGIVEVPHPNGPYGAKGFSENSISGPPSAIISAIHDACGVWITDYPATQERVLKALNEKALK
jgi:CO/xanthine dehydrogenase Mo-binding subunit